MLLELTREITPPTKNGHVPPPQKRGETHPFQLYTQHFCSCQRLSVSVRLAAQASALACRQESFLIPSKQEAVEEDDGMLVVLLSLLCHQVGWKAQEEAGELGGDHGDTDIVVF